MSDNIKKSQSITNNIKATLLGKVAFLFLIILSGVSLSSYSLAGCNDSLKESLEQSSMCRGSYNLACHYVRVRADILTMEYVKDAIEADKGRFVSNIGQKRTEDLIFLLKDKVEYLEDKGPSCLKAATMGRQISQGFIKYPKEAVLQNLFGRLNSSNAKYIDSYLEKHIND